MLLPFQGAALGMCAFTQGVASLALGYGLDGLSARSPCVVCAPRVVGIRGSEVVFCELYFCPSVDGLSECCVRIVFFPH